MKKLSESQRRRFARKARWGNLKARTMQSVSAFTTRLQGIARAKARFESVVSALPEVPIRRVSEQRMVFTDPPLKFSFADNYDASLAFIMELRKTGERKPVGANRNELTRWRACINLARIEDIDPAAGLVLAAELDSKRSHLRNLRSQDELWHENVRTFFVESGLFDLLKVAPQTVQAKAASAPLTRVLQYRKGQKPDGAQADGLRRELEALCGESFGPRVAVNNALCEAMTNAHHHAYPDDQAWWPSTPPGNWWATCAWTPDSGRMHMVLYDQGVGIPATLPRSEHWSAALPIVDLLDPERTDAGLIQAALELRRTSTNIAGRGRGLHEMAEWIDKTESGFLRIWSGKGRVTYRPGKVVQRVNLKAPFCGTLIEWEIHRGT